MGRNLHIVFSHPGDGVSDDEFGCWYEEHIDEILEMPGFHAAQRYRLEPDVQAEGVVFPFRTLVVYEVDDDTAALMEGMRRHGLNSADSYAGRKAAGDDGPPLPDWWDQVRFASFNCIAVGPRHEA
ncbi:MAG: hypothetical protein IRZ32_11055 [Solirubrobacteraceae bacterium]|nr:hypothetical protein [Solirubrobacteraceae bacterium]